MLVVAFAAAPAFAREQPSLGLVRTPNQVVVTVPGKFQPLLRSVVVPQPTQLVRALSGEMVPLLPREFVRPLSRQVVRSLPGQMTQVLPGQITRSLPGEMVQALPGQLVR